MRIGDVEFDCPLALAPMAGISDAPFRRLCAELGADMTPSEMITSDVRLWDSRKTRHRLRDTGDGLPRIVQIAGYDPGMLADAARRARDLGALIVDINMGCPAKRVCKRLAGSSLLRDPDLVRRIAERVVASVDIPITLKMRTGWSPDSRNGVTIARIAEASGIAALTVHGRTRQCRFSGEAEYETIRRIKLAVGIPVIANGDIDSPEKARDVLEFTRADGIMIGRPARGRPWIFSEIRNSLSKDDENLSSLHLMSVRDIIVSHLDSLYSFYGESTGVRVGRKHLSWYAQHQDGADVFRDRVVRVETAREQLELTRAFSNLFSRKASTARVRSGRERGGEDDQQEEIKDQKEEDGREIGRHGSSKQAA
ncbi:MAG TPA: tRNA dihydrouridine synthase DusB [Gammaproteobacteria bacterium]